MLKSPTALESEPCFCYGAHADALRTILRRLCVMSPLHSCWHPNQVRYGYSEWSGGVEGQPIFFLVKDAQPLPADFLNGLNAIVVEIQLTNPA